MALLHDGSEAERQSLRREVVKALRGGVPANLAPGRFAPAVPSLTEEAHAARVRRAQEYIASGDVYQLVLASRFQGHHSLAPFEVYRALRLLNPSPYMYFCELGDITVVGSSPEALVKCHGGHAQLRPIAGSRPPRCRCRARPGAGSGTAGGSEGERRARHAGGPGAQRPGPRRRGGLGEGRSLPCDRALQPHHAHRQRRQRPLVAGTGCLRFIRRDFSGGHSGGRAQGAGHGNHRRARTGGAPALRRHGGLFRQAWRHGSGDHHPHPGFPRRFLQLPGRGRHRRRQFPQSRIRRADGEERRAAQRLELAAEGL